MRYTDTVIMHDPKHWAATVIHSMEIALAVVVAVAIAISLVQSFGVLSNMDWSSIATFYEMLNRVLLIVIGLEFVRMLMVRNLISVLELLAFVVARKMLKPDMPGFDLMLGAAAFVLLIGTRYLIGHYHSTRSDSDASLLSQDAHD